MENTNQSLSNLIRSSSEQGRGQSDNLIDNTSFNTYLNIFALNLVHRFQDITDLDRINQRDIRSLAEFSVATATIAREVWENVGGVSMSYQGNIPRQTRAA